MTRSAILLGLLLFAGAAPGATQTMAVNPPGSLADGWHMPGPPRQARTAPVIAFPPAEQVRADGSRARLRGILLAKDVAPNVTIGLGLLDMKPRKSALSPNPGLDGSARASRKAAVRLSVSF